MTSIQTENDLIAVAAALIGPSVMLSPGEKALQKKVSRRAIEPAFLSTIRDDILAGKDPLGNAFAAIRSATERRATGAVYTPLPIVRSMMAWLSAQAHRAASSIRARARVALSSPQAKLFRIPSSSPSRWTPWPR